LRGRPIGKLLLQPTNCNTAAGIFLPPAYRALAIPTPSS
jgi:hypothetical protein